MISHLLENYEDIFKANLQWNEKKLDDECNVNQLIKEYYNDLLEIQDYVKLGGSKTLDKGLILAGYTALLKTGVLFD